MCAAIKTATDTTLRNTMDLPPPRKRRRSHKSRTSTALTFFTIPGEPSDETEVNQRSKPPVTSHVSLSIQRTKHGRLQSSTSIIERPISNEEVNPTNVGSTSAIMAGARETDTSAGDHSTATSTFYINIGVRLFTHTRTNSSSYFILNRLTSRLSTHPSFGLPNAAKCTWRSCIDSKDEAPRLAATTMRKGNTGVSTVSILISTVLAVSLRGMLKILYIVLR